MEDNSLNRFLGGAPFAVLLKLITLSLIVGACMAWLDIRPGALLVWAQHLAMRLWDSGLDAVQQFAAYIAAGAAIVVPLFIVSRILSAGSGDLRRSHQGRWNRAASGSPGAPPDGSPVPWRQDTRS